MRLPLMVAVVLAMCVATVVGASAWAARATNTFVLPCQDATVTLDSPDVLWPPDHKFHPYTATYDGGTAGDVVTITALSTDGMGVEQTEPVTATVQPGLTSASASVGLFAEHAKPGTTARMYVVWFAVTGSNSCGGAVGVVAPVNGRPV